MSAFEAHSALMNINIFDPVTAACDAKMHILFSQDKLVETDNVYTISHAFN